MFDILSDFGCISDGFLVILGAFWEIWGAFWGPEGLPAALEATISKSGAPRDVRLCLFNDFGLIWGSPGRPKT